MHRKFHSDKDEFSHTPRFPDLRIITGEWGILRFDFLDFRMSIHPSNSKFLLHHLRDASSRVTGLLFMILLLSLQPIFQAVANNGWSLQITRRIFTGQFQSSISAPPGSNPKAYLLEARYALTQQEYPLARAIVAPHLDDSNPISWAIEAEALAGQGQILPAIHAWEQASNILALLEIARKRLDRNDTGTALHAARAVYSIEPELYTTYYAELLWNAEKDWQSAVGLLQQSIHRFPDSQKASEWYRLLGELHIQREDFSIAEDYLRRSITGNPRDWRAYHLLGLALVEQNHPLEEALAPFRAALKDQAAAGEASFEAASMLSEIGNYIEADYWYNQALLNEPEQKGWYLARADAMRNSGDLQNAIALYNETILRFPDFALAYHQLAWAYYLNQDKPQAVITIEKAGELLSEQPVWYLERAGLIFEWAGDKDKALSTYQKILALNNNHPSARQAVERLSKP